MRILPGYILVEPIEDGKVSSGGVYLPESSQDKPMKGKVVAIGGSVFHDAGLEKIKCPVVVGDIVIHKKWINETYSKDGKEYLFVRFSDLLAIE